MVLQVLACCHLSHTVVTGRRFCRSPTCGRTVIEFGQRREYRRCCFRRWRALRPIFALWHHEETSRGRRSVCLLLERRKQCASLYLRRVTIPFIYTGTSSFESPQRGINRSLRGEVTREDAGEALPSWKRHIGAKPLWYRAYWVTYGYLYSLLPNAQ